MKTSREFVDFIRDEARAYTPWSPDELKQGGNSRAVARQLMSRHDHGPLDRMRASEREMMRDNCGACALARAGKDTTDPNQRPNYSGWLRVYIQAGEAVPQAWLEAEMVESAKENPAYYNAIMRDIATHSIHRAHHAKEAN